MYFPKPLLFRQDTQNTGCVGEESEKMRVKQDVEELDDAVKKDPILLLNNRDPILLESLHVPYLRVPDPDPTPSSCEAEKSLNRFNTFSFFFFFCRSDAVAGVDQSSGKVQPEDQDPPADSWQPGRPTAAQGTEKRQRVFYSLWLFLSHGGGAPQTGLIDLSVFTLQTF